MYLYDWNRILLQVTIYWRFRIGRDDRTRIRATFILHCYSNWSVQRFADILYLYLSYT